MTANYHMQNIMQNLISSAPNFTNLIQAYEYVALKRAQVTYFNTGIHNRERDQQHQLSAGSCGDLL